MRSRPSCRETSCTSPRNASKASVVGDDVVGVPLICLEARLDTEDLADQLRDGPDVRHIVTRDVEHSGALGFVERTQYDLHDIVDVDRVHARAASVVQPDQLLRADAVGKPRDHAPNLSGTVRNEEAQ